MQSSQVQSSQVAWFTLPLSTSLTTGGVVSLRGSPPRLSAHGLPQSVIVGKRSDWMWILGR